jgi:hypothetical protein
MFTQLLILLCAGTTGMMHDMCTNSLQQFMLQYQVTQNVDLWSQNVSKLAEKQAVQYVDKNMVVAIAGAYHIVSSKEIKTTFPFPLINCQVELRGGFDSDTIAFIWRF